ncbi:MAG: dienelactone hydrolase family protein, partial [Chloroflexi bacterium]|nr:dienelactone hydrolase family protein [Chloroflexota bacterium]
SEKIGLAGYSFGGCAVLKAAPLDPRVLAVAAVSPFISISNTDPLTRYDKPKLFIGGSHDNIVSPEMFADLVQKVAEPKISRIIQGASHFWMGYTETVSGMVSAFFSDVFNGKEN